MRYSSCSGSPFGDNTSSGKSFSSCSLDIMVLLRSTSSIKEKTNGECTPCLVFAFLLYFRYSISVCKLKGLYVHNVEKYKRTYVFHLPHAPPPTPASSGCGPAQGRRYRQFLLL